MLKRIHFIVIIFLQLQLIFLYIVRQNPLLVEKYYSNAFYPYFFNIHKSLLNNISFSIGDFLYLFIATYLIISFLKIIKGGFNFKYIITKILSIISIIIFIFYSSWGLNYFRLPLNKKLGYNINYTEKEIENTLNILVKNSNHLHEILTNNDSLAVKVPYNKAKIASLIENGFNFDLEKYDAKPYLKNSMLSTPLSYMGYAGYLNPFTLEAQINSKVPKLNYIFTAAHEMAHQLGVASESEANFIAFYTCIKNLDPFIQFSGYVFALNYCYNELIKVNPLVANKEIKNLNFGIKENFRELSQFWKSYQNPIEPILKKGFDSYLKVNGQTHGIKSYDEMTSLIIAYLQKRI